jgi:hypothetical protein
MCRSGVTLTTLVIDVSYLNDNTHSNNVTYIHPHL